MGPSRKTIIANELAWHEKEARRRFSLDEFLYAPPVFDEVVRSGLAFLALQPGQPVLEIGCGEGKETLALARLGALVVATDLSRQQLMRARQRVLELAPAGRVWYIQANAEELPFAAGTFRAVYGKAILHHLDLARAARETTRVLGRPGRATFAEPMAGHPLFRLARRLTPQLRTGDEHPLSFTELKSFGAYFSAAQIEGYFLLAPLAYIFRLLPGGEPIFRRCYAALARVDGRLFRAVARLCGLAWYGLIKVSG